MGTCQEMSQAGYPLLRITIGHEYVDGVIACEVKRQIDKLDGFIKMLSIDNPEVKRVTLDYFKLREAMNCYLDRL